MIHIAVHRTWLWSTTPAGSPTRGAVARFRSARVASRDAGGRVLARCTLRDGGSAMATDRALIVAGPDGLRHRLDWADIAEVGWSASDAATVIATWPGTRTTRGTALLRSDRRFAAVVAERVATSQVLRRRVSLTESVDATIVATRVSARDTTVTWRVMIDPGAVDGVGRAAVAAAADHAIAELKALAGC